MKIHRTGIIYLLWFTFLTVQPKSLFALAAKKKILILNFVEISETRNVLDGVKGVLSFTKMKKESSEFDDILTAIEKRSKLRNKRFSSGKIDFFYFNFLGKVHLSDQEFKSMQDFKPDLIFPITTPITGWAVKKFPNVPTIFSMVSYPQKMKFIPSFKQSGRYISGTSNIVPVPQQLDYLKHLLPNAKRGAYIFNDSEKQTRGLLGELKEYEKKSSYKFVHHVANTKEEIEKTMGSLNQKEIDFFVMPNSSFYHTEPIANAYYALAKKPVLATSGADLKKGALFLVGCDFLNLGKQTGRMIAKFLRGTPISSITPERPKKLKFGVNAVVAKKYNLDLKKLPRDVLAQINKIVDKPGNSR